VKETLMKVFIAGGSGAIGKQLVPQLRAAGHEVVAMTRTPGKADSLSGRLRDRAVGRLTVGVARLRLEGMKAVL